MQVPFLDLSRYPEQLKSALQNKFVAMLGKGIFSGGAEVADFEAKLCQFTKSEHAIACSNGTDALEVALRALDVGVGDKVIVPVLTWVSTIEVVKLVGAEPVLAAIGLDGLLNFDELNKNYTPEVKAILPVHLYGNMVEMEKLMEWAAQKNVQVIEDGAQSFGAHRSGKHAGTFGNIGCLSFYPTKNLGALGEAGALLTQDELLAKKIRKLINHGQEVRDNHTLLGKNARIDSMQAGFLNVMIAQFPQWQQIRAYQAQRYRDAFAELSEIEIVKSHDENSYNAHLFVLRTVERDRLKHFLSENGIETKIHYPYLLSQMPPYKTDAIFLIGEQFVKEILSIPLNPWLEEGEQNKIIATIKKFFK